MKSLAMHFTNQNFTLGGCLPNIFMEHDLYLISDIQMIFAT